jgi:TrmH family RNA methyltransferase
LKAVSSRDNAVFKAMAKLVASASERRKTGLTVIEGAHLLAAFLDSGRRPEEVMVSKAGLARAEVAGLVERSAPARVTLLADALFDSISSVESPTGVLACVRTPAARLAPPDAPLALLLEDIQDPGNVGSLLRSAAAAGATHVLLSPQCAFAWSPKVLRAAMGAHFALDIAEGVALAEWVAAYRGTAVALAGDASSSLYELDLRGPVAFLVGNEGAGLSAGLRAAARVAARIPLAARMESLNAAAAGTIALFEAVRQRAAPRRSR